MITVTSLYHLRESGNSGQFRHLKDDKWSHLVDDFQMRVDEQWKWLLEEVTCFQNINTPPYIVSAFQ